GVAGDAIGAAHDDPAPEQARELRLTLERAGEVRQRAARHERDLAGPGPDVLDPHVDGVAVAERAFGRRELGVAEALRSMRFGRRLARPDSRLRCAPGHP